MRGPLERGASLTPRTLRPLMQRLLEYTAHHQALSLLAVAAVIAVRFRRRMPCA
jgi:hypothetical protein